MKSPVVKRSVVIGRHKTSVSLEVEFWTAVRKIAREKHVTVSTLVEQVDTEKALGSNLSSALRVFVLRQCQEALAAAKATQPTP